MSISNHLPPAYRDRLVAAADHLDERRRIADIDQITDELARAHPELVLRRATDRPRGMFGLILTQSTAEERFLNRLKEAA